MRTRTTRFLWRLVFVLWALAPAARAAGLRCQNVLQPEARRAVGPEAEESLYVERFTLHIHDQLKQHPDADAGVLDLRAGPEVPYVYKGPERFIGERGDVKWLLGQNRLDQLYLHLEKDSSVSRLSRVLSLRDGQHEAEAVLRNFQLQGSVDVPMQALLPSPFARSRTGTFQRPNEYNPIQGPNCLAASLQWDPRYTGIKFVDGQVYEGLLQKLGYRKLREGEPRHFGDVLVFKDPTLSTPVIHAERYLSANFVWHKNTTYRDDPWTFERFDSTLTFLAKKWREREKKDSDILQLEVWTWRP